MKTIISSTLLIILFAFQGTISYASNAIASNRAYGEYGPGSIDPDGLPVAVGYDSPEGRLRLMRSKYNNDYFELSSHFQPQINPLYCGIATSVIVLNSLRISKGTIPSQAGIEIEKPKAAGGGILSYPSYSQLTLLDEKTDLIKKREVIDMKARNLSGKYSPGLTLDQLKRVLESYGVQVSENHIKSFTDEDVSKFRDELKMILKDNDHYMIINVDGQVYGAAVHGHISPVAAYDEISDSVLVLDVAGHKNPWYWVPVKDLYAAMNTKDGSEYRGYLIVSDKL